MATGGTSTTAGNSFGVGVGSEGDINLSDNGTLVAKGGSASNGSFGCGAKGSIEGTLDAFSLYVSGNTYH